MGSIHIFKILLRTPSKVSQGNLTYYNKNFRKPNIIKIKKILKAARERDYTLKTL